MGKIYFIGSGCGCKWFVYGGGSFVCEMNYISLVVIVDVIGAFYSHQYFSVFIFDNSVSGRFWFDVDIELLENVEVFIFMSHIFIQITSC